MPMVWKAGLLTPVVDDMPAALMVADVVVMPSITPELFGRVALEAWVTGRPIVAFDTAAVESIEHGKTGGWQRPAMFTVWQKMCAPLNIKAAARNTFVRTRAYQRAFFNG